jgi:hypothetical protein
LAKNGGGNMPVENLPSAWRHRWHQRLSMKPAWRKYLLKANVAAACNVAAGYGGAHLGAALGGVSQARRSISAVLGFSCAAGRHRNIETGSYGWRQYRRKCWRWLAAASYRSNWWRLSASRSNQLA